jgi:hypothetical protein
LNTHGHINFVHFVRGENPQALGEPLREMQGDLPWWGFSLLTVMIWSAIASYRAELSVELTFLEIIIRCPL